jgi:hypothetical protein
MASRAQSYYCPNFLLSPNLEGQVPVFISPRNRVAQLYPRVLGSLSVTPYDSQGYGVGILTRLHMGPIYTVALGTKVHMDRGIRVGPLLNRQLQDRPHI